jgi:hypothetical protein
MRYLAILLLTSLAGCSTLNGLGIGGEPRLMCSFRDGRAYIDDKLAGTDKVRGSVLRAFEDGASLCLALKPAAIVATPAANAANPAASAPAAK